MEYVCNHLSTTDYIASESTCAIEGVHEWQCNYCETVVKQTLLPLAECTWEDWVVLKMATPIETGEKSRTCQICNDIEYEEYSMEMAGENAIYIPGSGINHTVTNSSFTQWAVDRYDIVYTESAMKNGSQNPFVLGHSTRTMGALPETAIGQNVYLCINGEIEVYIVRVSEPARVTNYGSDITGYNTGASLWDTYSSKTLHMYTCYGSNSNGRWLVLAEKIE